LANLEGREPFDAALGWLSELDSAPCARWAAWGLAASANPHLDALHAALRSDGSSAARAAGLVMAGWLGRGSIEDLCGHVGGDTILAPTALAQLSDAARPNESIVALVAAQLERDEPDIVYAAARTLALWGDHRGLEHVRHNPALALTLGAKALELYVLCGSGEHLDEMDRLVRRQVVLPAHLAAIGRFGHPASWAFLAHYLLDDMLDDAAVDALGVLFGHIVSDDSRYQPDAWESAIADLELSDNVRYRRGVAWSAEILLNEITSGELSAEQMHARIDELRARAVHPAPQPPQLMAWGDDGTEYLDAFVRATTGARTIPW
jgi:hypothetical protein